MTVQIDGSDVMTLVEWTVFAGGAVLMLMAGLLVYLLVRPPRRRGDAAGTVEPREAEEMVRLLDLMERRLTLLEQGLADRSDRSAGAGREREFNDAERRK